MIHVIKFICEFIEETISFFSELKELLISVFVIASCIGLSGLVFFDLEKNSEPYLVEYTSENSNVKFEISIKENIRRVFYSKEVTHKYYSDGKEWYRNETHDLITGYKRKYIERMYRKAVYDGNIKKETKKRK